MGMWHESRNTDLILVLMMFDDAFLSSFKMTHLRGSKRNLSCLLSAVLP